MSWFRRMFGREHTEPDNVDRQMADAQARHVQVIAKADRVLTEAHRLDLMRNSARRAGQRMTR